MVRSRYPLNEMTVMKEIALPNASDCCSSSNGFAIRAFSLPQATSLRWPTAATLRRALPTSASDSLVSVRSLRHGEVLR